MALENPALNAASFQKGAAEAAEAQRRGMTATGTYARTAFLLLLLLVAAAFGWSQVEIVSVGGRQVVVQPGWTWLAIVLTLVFGMAGAFAYKSAGIFGPLYVLSEGALLGVASHYFNIEYQGIVLQAVLATVCIFAAMLFLYGARIIRVTRGFVLGVAGAMGALLLLWFTAWVVSLFGVNFAFLYQPTPLGILLSLGIVILGALNLPIDFNFIENASSSGAPRYMEWYGAFGLTLSLIWIYVSILRLLALLRAASS
ncbi:MAG TPA: Bax inhibitor-1/YccA family protein [Chloroflexota bacterium]|nr:Bax inhibitor-1/YccA family protein [Chloroflexota bacterium]